MSYNLSDILKKENEEDDENIFPTFVLPNCLGNGTFVNYFGLWLSKVIFPSAAIFDELKEFQFFKDDVLVASYLKSGTTWVQEIVSQIEILHREDGREWKSIILEDRFPFLEYVHPGIKEIAKMKSPRLIKTHLPYHLLPPSVASGTKIIYVARNPKDVCVSLYHFLRLLKFISYTGPFEEFFNYFFSGKVYFGPYENHVLPYWEKRQDKNHLFLTYENIHKEPHKIIKQISNFINKPITIEQLDNIVNSTKFDVMKDDPSTNYSWWDDNGISNKSEGKFFRKGIVGDWKNYMDDDMLKKVEKYFEENPGLKEIFNQ